MTKNIKHYQALDQIVTNALLALYCNMAQQGGFWTTKKRNEFLIKFIKPKVKQPQFSMCKNEIKAMLYVGRSAKGNLEHKLWELNKLNHEYQLKFSHIDDLYIMLHGIFESNQFSFAVKGSESDMKIDTIYVKSKEISKGFNKNKKQIKPLAMMVKTHRLAVLIDAVQAKGIYRVEVNDLLEDSAFYFLLHRKGT